MASKKKKPTPRKAYPVKYSEEERALVDARASAAGLKRGTWIRMVTLEHAKASS